MAISALLLLSTWNMNKLIHGFFSDGVLFIFLNEI